MRALIVDDEPDIACLLELTLREAGFQTQALSDGEAALQEALREPPDLVLLDRMLPGLSGDEVCRALKREPRTRHVPVVLVTARATERDRITGLELGADDYVTKPFFPRELVLRCRALARRSPLPAAAAPGGRALPGWANAIHLSPGEQLLLTELSCARGNVLPLARLIAALPPAERRSTRTLHARMRKLRRKLVAAGAQLEVLRRVGYRLVAPSP